VWESLAIRLVRDQESAGSNPATPTDFRKGKPMGDGSRLERGRARALGVRLPLLPLRR
jgi:hypothetical protein